MPGGAANVAANVHTLGGRVDLISVLGDDDAAARLASLMARNFPGARIDHCVTEPSRPTTTKTRVIGNNHQVVRLDRERNSHVAVDCAGRVLAAVESRLAHCDIVVLSDYNKGVCSDEVIRGVIERASKAGKPVLVDPKRRDFSIYKGASLVKPNASELAAAAGFACVDDEDVVAAARHMSVMTGSDFIVTRSEKGMSYVSLAGDVHHVPTAARRVFDVSGAGDTVIAALALGLLSERPIAQILAYANAAASVVVGKAGTATVTADEVDAELSRSRKPARSTKDKVASRAEAKAIRERWRSEGHEVTLTNGCFDLLHPGHVALLEEAAAQGQRLIVALNTDASVSRLKGPARPLQREQDRARVMAAIGVVDLVVLFDEDTPSDLIADMLPDVLVKGSDYAVEQTVGAAEVIAAGGRVHLVDLVAGKSTSSIVKRMG